MKTKIATFITTIIFLLFGTTTVVAQNVYFQKGGTTIFQSAISDIDSIVFKQGICDGDFSIINGVKWATRNVGAPGTFVAKPEDYGQYYQWNKGTTDFLLYNDYYNSVYAKSDVWLKANDPSPAGWRVPTLAEIQSLLDINNVTNEWTTVNGINGRKFTDKATGSCLFLPAAGGRNGSGGSLGNVGSGGDYWGSTPSGSLSAYDLFFYSGGAYWSYYSRGSGFSVRCVSE